MIEYPADFSNRTALGQEVSIVTCRCVTNLRKFSNLIPHYFWGSGTWALLDWLRFPDEVITKLQASGCNLRRFDWGWGIWEARSHDCWWEIFSSLPGDPFWGLLRHSMGSSRVSDPRKRARERAQEGSHSHCSLWLDVRNGVCHMLQYTAFTIFCWLHILLVHCGRGLYRGVNIRKRESLGSVLEAGYNSRQNGSLVISCSG